MPELEHLTRFQEAAEHACNFTDEIEQIEKLQEEIKRMQEWLGFTDVCEPATQAALAYGDADLAELQARHRDWLDEKRTQQEAIY